jgi:IS30 family transposase
MLSVEDWAEIRRLHRAEKLPIKQIARVVGVSRNTVRGGVAQRRSTEVRAGRPAWNRR